MAKPTQKTFVTSDQNGPVECLGMTFPNDQARRDYFMAKLKEKLKDPKFRKIEGFPMGEDEDILSISDPPFYTACPNPFLIDFFQLRSASANTQPTGYRREPFAADVSEGKNDPIYNAHSYHTKVPHKAIIRYILHYTNPGDVVFDGFCGTGMTGIAAQLCGNRSQVKALGYRVDNEGNIHDSSGNLVSKLGSRYSVLTDLSPAATFISLNYTRPLSYVFERSCNTIIDATERELGWLYKTEDASTNAPCEIESVIWSDVYLCPSCSHEIEFWSHAKDDEDGGVLDGFPCTGCGTELTKPTMDQCYESIANIDGMTVRRIKHIPVSIIYRKGNTRYEKEITRGDLQVLNRAYTQAKNHHLPTLRFNPDSEQYKRDALHLRGITTVSDFYTSRNLLVMARLWERAQEINDAPLRQQVLWLLTSSQWLVSVMYRYRTSGGGGQQGKLTIPSLMREQNVFRVVRGKLADILKSEQVSGRECFISTSSATDMATMTDNSIDYIFTDPPFGGNLYYSDLNRIWEGWLRVFTNEKPEAVVHRARVVQAKSLGDYTDLMRNSFKEAFRILKPGHWITVEFHNSSNAVWNAIQEALANAGFVVADVRTLDKQQGTFKQVTDPSSVKQDLVITSYKPDGELEEKFLLEAGTEAGVWNFVTNHLKQLPVFVSKGNKGETLAERQNYLLFDRMVAFHVQRGVRVPLSASEFYSGLRTRYAEQDGMYFLRDQLPEYLRKRKAVSSVEQLELFVSNEKSAIQWVRQQLSRKPMTYQDLAPIYMREARKSVGET